MSVNYRAVQWSGHKLRYDAVVLGAVVAFIGLFVFVNKLWWSGDHAVSDEVVLIRALGACALTLLHVVLAIGPLSRIEPRFLPVLANRRHLGVTTFLLGVTHAAVSVGYYHGFGVENPLRSLLTSNVSFGTVRGFPFEPLGVGALAMLFVLAATSHDFWLKNLGAIAWKRLHMLVYVAYVLLVGHVVLGSFQREAGVLAWGGVAVGVVVLAVVHGWAALKESRRDQVSKTESDAGGEWIDAGDPMAIPEDRAVVLCTPRGERIALFRHRDGLSALSNVCAHQGGPLGEGKIIDGCVTCPWHGWQYRPSDGCAPPPFVERVRTFEVRVVAGRALVRTAPRVLGEPEARALEGGHE